MGTYTMEQNLNKNEKVDISEEKQYDPETRIMNILDLNLKKYNTVSIKYKILSKDNKIILFEKDIRQKQISGIWLCPAEAIAKEQKGEVIRGDKALQTLWRTNKGINKIKAMVIGKIHKRSF